MLGTSAHICGRKRLFAPGRSAPVFRRSRRRIVGSPCASLESDHTYVCRRGARYHIHHLSVGCLNVPTKVGTQCERTVIVQFLMTSPPHRIAHSLYLNLSSKFQSFPICRVRKHKLRLTNLARQWVAGIQATTLEHFSVLPLHG